MLLWEFNGIMCVNCVTLDTQIVNPFALFCLSDWIDNNFELNIGDFRSATIIFTRAFHTLEALSLGIFLLIEPSLLRKFYLVNFYN